MDTFLSYYREIKTRLLSLILLIGQTLFEVSSAIVSKRPFLFEFLLLRPKAQKALSGTILPLAGVGPDAHTNVWAIKPVRANSPLEVEQEWARITCNASPMGTIPASSRYFSGKAGSRGTGTTRHLSQKGQNLIEYAIVVAVVVSAMLAMSTYVFRSVQSTQQSIQQEFADQ